MKSIYFAALLLISQLFAFPLQAAAPQAAMPERHIAFLDSHCMECHDSATQKGKLNLEALPMHIKTVKEAEIWQQVLNSLNAGEMPPEKQPVPDPKAKTEFLADLSGTLFTARKILSDTGGVTTLRRLNQREYRNTIRDLLGVSIKAESLPTDSRDGSFDTAGSSLYISSDQISTYRELGNDALKLAFDLASNSLEPKKIRFELEASTNQRMAKEVELQVSAQKRYRRWTKLVDAASGKPENATVAHEIRKGLNRPEDFYEHWERIKGAPSPLDYGFSDGRDAIHYNGQWEWVLPLIVEYQSLSHTDTGIYITEGSLATQFVIYEVPGNWPTGDYIMRINAATTTERDLMPSRHEQKSYTTPGPDKSRCFLDIDSRTGNYNISTHRVRGTFESPVTIETRLTVRADEAPHLFHLKERGGLELRPQNLSTKSLRELGVRTDPAIWIDWVEVEGPVRDKKTVECLGKIKGWLEQIESQDILAIRKILNEFSAVALRGRTPAPEFLDKLESIYEDFRADEFTSRDALRETLAIVLASPGFLYLAEAGDDAKGNQLSQIELASRLSYFLWSAPPDAELLALARGHQLAIPEVLKQQTGRMLADSRSHTFVEAFLDQWLGLDRLDFFQFNAKKHSDFHAGMKKAARREIYETFSHWLRHRENRSLSNLLKSDTIVINALLADLYGIPDIDGDDFRPVKVASDSPRGGLLGMAAVAAMGSNGDDTSPVERGAWVLRKLIYKPPPPAPPNVPQLSRLEKEVLSTRERIAMHQEQPQCAQCHRRIDPIGFGLENFNAAGKWRTIDDREGTPVEKSKIDPSGAFHNGPSFQDYFQLRDIIANTYADAFAKGFTENLAEYALGRPIGFMDADLIANIISTAKSRNYAIDEFIHALVASNTFREKR